MADSYADSLLSINPNSGDLEFDTISNRWATGIPAVVRVVLVLRTVRGSCGLDPTFGMDWKAIDKLAPNAPALAKQLVRAALKPLLDDSSIRGVKVDADMRLSQGALLISVDFTDVRASRNFRVRLQQPV